MAGGKETPRQKMIGLMYLVLLALLALQVSSDIMLKFLQMEQSMKQQVIEADDKAGLTLGAIESAAKEDGRESSIKKMELAQELNKVTNGVQSTIEEIKQQMIEKSGGIEEGVPKGMKDADVASTLLIGEAGGTKLGKKLEAELDNFAKELDKIQKQVAAVIKTEKPDLYSGLNMTPDGKEDPVTAKDEAQRNKPWLAIAFDHAPMIAALSYLTEKQARVANYRAELLKKIQASLGAEDISFDQIFPMASAESKVVAAGTNYEADLFITATSSSNTFQPKMFMNGREIKVDESAKGKVKFKASWGGGKVDPKNKNLMKKSWKGKIIMKDGTGKDVPYEQTFQYLVAKPVLQVQSASVAALYRQCGNELIINCPALGATYDPKFSATGAQVRPGKKKGEVVIIPGTSSKKVELTVKSGGTKLGVEKFKVRAVPKPEVIVYAKGKPVDQKKGVPSPGPRQLQIRAKVSDDYFVQNLPRDSKYKVTKWTAMLVRGRRPVGGAMTNTSETANMNRIAANAQPGDRILIEIKEVRRAKYLGGTEVVTLPGVPIVNIPLF